MGRNVSFSLQAEVVSSTNPFISLGWNNCSNFYVPGGTQYYGTCDFSFTIQNGSYNNQDLLTTFESLKAPFITTMNTQANTNKWGGTWAFSQNLAYVVFKNQTVCTTTMKNSWLLTLDSLDVIQISRYRLYMYPSEVAFMLGWDDSGVTNFLGPPMQIGDPINLILNPEIVYSSNNVDALPNFITYITCPSFQQTNSYNSIPTTNEIDMEPSNVLCSVPLTNIPYSGSDLAGTANKSFVDYTYIEFNYPLKFPSQIEI